MKKRKIVIAVILYSIAAISGFFFCREYTAAQTEIQEYTELQQNFATLGEELLIEQASTIVKTDTVVAEKRIDFAALRAINFDVAAWLTIPDTQINYPVVQSDDNAKYLTTSFSGKPSKTGALFVDSKNSIAPPDKNIIIYGHNMGAGRQDMFGGLLLYKDAEYAKSHSNVMFEILEEIGDWQVFAVLHLNMAQSYFNYLQQTFTSDVEFENWLNTAKELSIAQTNIPTANIKRALTLSTCDRSRYGRNGRIVLVAVQKRGNKPWIQNF